MLKPQKRKITKKDLKEDKFVEFTLKAKMYLEENYQQLAYAVIAVAIIIIGIVVYKNQHQKTKEKANTLLGEAQMEYQSMNFTKARNFLTRLIEEYSGTDAAVQGYFILANLDFQQEKYQQAEEAFKKFIDDYDGSPILLASGYAGYAACLEHRGAYREAAENYLKAQKSAPDFVEAANYLYLAGKNFLAAGDKERAMEIFEELVEKYKDSKRVNDAKAQLIILAKK